MLSGTRYDSIYTLILNNLPSLESLHSIEYLSFSLFLILFYISRLAILNLNKHHPTGRVMQRWVHTTLTVLIISKLIWMFEIMVIEDAEIYRQDVWVMKHQTIHHAIPIWRWLLMVSYFNPSCILAAISHVSHIDIWTRLSTTMTEWPSHLRIRFLILIVVQHCEIFGINLPISLVQIIMHQQTRLLLNGFQLTIMDFIHSH